MRLVTLLLSTLLLLPAAMARADDTYLLQTKSQVGQSRQIDVVTHRDHNRVTSVNGVDRPPVVDKSVSYFKAVVTAVEVKDGSPVAAKIVVDKQSRTVTDVPGGDPQTTYSPLAGATMTIRRADDNTFSSDFNGDISDADWSILRPLVAPSSTILPDHPIAVGTEWTTTDKAKPYLTLGPTDEGKQTCKLESVKLENGHHIAEITITTTEVRHLDYNIEVDVKDIARLRFDIDAGRSLGINSKADGIIATPPGQAVQINGTIADTTETKSTELPADAATTTPAAP
jgi:hypothetical protein